VNGVPGKVGSVAQLIETVDGATSRDTLAPAASDAEPAGDDKTRATLDDFYLLKVIGKGSFGKVR
jgi:hypothetical protein